MADPIDGTIQQAAVNPSDAKESPLGSVLVGKVPVHHECDVFGNVHAVVCDAFEESAHTEQSDGCFEADVVLASGALSILAETLAGTDDEEARTRLAMRLQQEAARMANVIDDVVRLAETESLGIEFEVVEISGLVDAALDSVAPLAADKDIGIVRAEIADGAVAASREQVTSAIRDLLENAIMYTSVKDGPGKVTIRVLNDDGMMLVEVQDTGVGVPEQYVERVFERFFRVDRARSRQSGGTGLGLSIVKNVAQAHGGSVQLTSIVGVGSTFTIRLPAARADTA